MLMRSHKKLIHNESQRKSFVNTGGKNTLFSFQFIGKEIKNLLMSFCLRKRETFKKNVSQKFTKQWK